MRTLLKMIPLALCVLAGAGVAVPIAALAATAESLAFARQLRGDFKSQTGSTGVLEQLSEKRDFEIGAQSPAREIPVRLYRPGGATDQTLPIVLFVHGGGFVAGDLDSYDVMLSSLTNRTDAVVLSVDYRLAPENPFPAGLEDAYAVLVWAAANAATFGADGTRIAISGDSAGGNIAAATAMLARDRNGPKLAAQFLMYPTLSNKMDTASWKELGETHFPSREVNSKVIEAYVPEGVSPYGPLVAPLWGKHTDLPPALLVVGNLDPLRDENRDYADALNKVDVEARTVVYPRSQHGFVQFYQLKDVNPDGEAALAYGAAFLKSKLGSK
ncbi:Carboxylesterase NlhH (modular protein) [Agrobacterium deltaense NCPPB 1641]|uniref:Carboxylesterase NlhH (Modular protein) n=2 Tax=Rhizobium/Agrobacterium group TaxID=227290 RepID=A0A1S7U937_9HYPH|nr:Carboxylesterase NlhH (modular protein) [Agrobacterium deltaense NCPPB 1641]